MNILRLLIIALSFGIFTGYGQQKQANKPLKIAYNVHIQGEKDNYDIYTVNSDGSNRKNITNHKDVAWIYHAYKKRLFFISDRDTCKRCYYLYECDSDGKNVKKVSGLRLEDSWMSTRKEGTEMVVSGRIGNSVRFQLFIINTKTGKYTQLTNDTVAKYYDPCFSPDGSKIVFSYKKNRRDKSTHEELYVMNADGSGEMKQLTHYPEDNFSASEYGTYRAGAARWHPTENFITYVSRRDGKHSIFAVMADGSKEWKLMDNSYAEAWHDWSPDGKWLLYNSSDVKESEFQLILMNWETKKEVLMSDPNVRVQQAPVFVE